MKASALVPLLALSLFLGACEKKSAATSPAAAEATPQDQGHVLARKGDLPAAGTVRTEVSTVEMQDAVLTVKTGQQDLDGTMSRSEKINEVVEGLAPGKARRTLASKTTEQRMVIMKQEQPGPEQSDPLQGLPVILENKDGAWTAVLESGTATSEQQGALAKLAEELEADSDFALYGDTSRKAGDKWEVDLKTLRSFGGAESLSGTFTVEFVEVKDLQGTPCAVLKSVFDLTGSSPSEDGEPGMKLKMKGESLTHRSLADLSDLEATMTATITAAGSPAPGVEMKVEGPMTATTKATIEKQ